MTTQKQEAWIQRELQAFIAWKEEFDDLHCNLAALILYELFITS